MRGGRFHLDILGATTMPVRLCLWIGVDLRGVRRGGILGVRVRGLSGEVGVVRIVRILRRRRWIMRYGLRK